MILLDTDSFTLHQVGHARFMERFQAAAEVPAITIITQVEALRGRQDALLKAEDGARLLRAQDGMVRTTRHLTLFAVVPFDDAAAAEFDRLRQNKKVKKIGRGDLLIAGIALAHRATLVTRNARHFSQIPGLRVENWAD
jgi:tRNA(fMet)-specific endonuclease VapC